MSWSLNTAADVVCCRQAYVVLGTSLTEAEAAWVLTTSLSAGTGTESHKGDSLEPGSLQMWDPTSGRCYSVTDPACQMRMVRAGRARRPAVGLRWAAPAALTPLCPRAGGRRV